MEWITDRNPNTPGLYAVHQTPFDNLPNCFGFAYFDGEGWLMASQAGYKLAPYRNNPKWSKIDWGQD